MKLHRLFVCCCSVSVVIGGFAAPKFALAGQEGEQTTQVSLAQLAKAEVCQPAGDWQSCLLQWMAVELMLEPASDVKLAYQRLLHVQQSKGVYLDLLGLGLHSLPPLMIPMPHLSRLDVRGNPLEYAEQDLWANLQTKGIEVDRGALPFDKSQQFAPLLLSLGQYVIQYGADPSNGQIAVAAARIQQAFIGHDSKLDFAHLGLRYLPDVWHYLPNVRSIDVTGNPLDSDKGSTPWRQQLASHGITVMQAAPEATSTNQQQSAPEEACPNRDPEQIPIHAALAQVKVMMEEVLDTGCWLVRELQKRGEQLHKQLGSEWRAKFEKKAAEHEQALQRDKELFQKEKEAMEAAWQRMRAY